MTLKIPDHGRFDLIKPLVGFQDDILEHLRLFPFQENVFLMMKFRPDNRALSDFIIETLDSHGLRGVRADQPEWNITNNVYNPLAVLLCCKYGLALFDEPEDGQTYSPNVAYELGMIHLQGKRCLILKHDSLPAVPFDLIKDLHVLYSRDLDVRPVVERWAQSIAPQSPVPGEGAVKVVAGAPEPASSTGSEILCGAGLKAHNAEHKVIQRSPRYWRFSWKIAVLNIGAADLRCRIDVQFLDQAGLALERGLHLSDVPLAPGQERTFSDSHSLGATLGGEVERLRFTVTPR